MFNEHSHRKVLVVIAYALVALAVEGALLITGVSSIEVNTTMNSSETMAAQPAEAPEKPQSGQTSQSVSVGGMSGSGTQGQGVSGGQSGQGSQNGQGVQSGGQGTAVPGNKPPLGGQQSNYNSN